MPQISVTITEAQAEMLAAAVAAGEYASASEALAEALAHWEEERYAQSPGALTSEELRVLWDEGIASGSAGAIDFDEVLLEAHERLQSLVRRTA